MVIIHKPDWTLRKRVILLSLYYCIGVLTYLLVRGQGDSAVHDTLVTYLLTLVFLIIGGYVFGEASDTHMARVSTDKGHTAMQSEEESSTIGEDTELGTWTARRRVILQTLVLAAAGILYLSVYGADTALNRTFASGLCLLYGGLLNSWIFGSVWEDYNLRTMRSTLTK